MHSAAKQEGGAWNKGSHSTSGDGPSRVGAGPIGVSLPFRPHVQVPGRRQGWGQKVEGWSLSLFIQERSPSPGTCADSSWDRAMSLAGYAGYKGVWEIRILDSTTSTEEAGRRESVGNWGSVCQPCITMAVVRFWCLMENQEGGGLVL